MKVPQHAFSKKVCEILENLKIPVEGTDKHSNPFIRPEHLKRLPLSVKADLEVKGCWRIIIRSYKQ